jgi:hypothetical protein
MEAIVGRQVEEGGMRITGKVVAELFGPDGKLKQRVETHNLVTTSGDGVLAGILAGGADEIHGMELGTGSTAAAKGDTAMETVVANSYEPMDATYPSAAAAVVTAKSTWAAGDVTQNGITEVGLFEDGTDGGASSGTMIARAILSPTVNKGANDSLAVTWTITLLGA